MPDEPVTTGELARRMERGFADLKEDVHELASRLDSKVANEVFQLQIAALTQRQAALEAKRDSDARTADNRRWMVYMSLLAAALSFVATLYFASRGSP